MNILVVRNDKLGDFITALPAIYLLKQHNPENKIVVCIAPLNKPLAQSCDFIDEVVIDRAEKSVFWLASKIREQGIDASVTLFSNTRVAFAQYLARITKTIAPATKIAQIFYTHRVKQRRSEVKMAEFEYNIALAKELFPTMKTTYPQPLLAFDDAKKVYEDFCKKHKVEKEIVIFHVGFGGSSDANLTLDEYENLIRNLLIQKKYQVAMSFGPDEKELYEAMQERFVGEDIVFYLSLDGLLFFAKLISQCKLFVSTSTGTYHLASLVGTPTLTFFADSLFASAKRWRAVGDEKLQKHYMLPSDERKREAMLKEINASLLALD